MLIYPVSDCNIYNEHKQLNSDWKLLFRQLGPDIIYNYLGHSLNQLCIYLQLFMPKNWIIDLDDFNTTPYTLTKINDDYLDSIQIE